MSNPLVKLAAPVVAAIAVFFVLRYGLRAALGENVFCAVGGLVAAYAVWTRVAAWEVKKLLGTPHT